MIDLTTWNLTIPQQTAETVISTQHLNNGYHSHYFRQNPDGSVTFWAPVEGSTTKGSSFPRSELRETSRDGRPLFWRYSSADNYLSAVLSINKVPSEKKIIIGQIHSKDEPGSMRDPLVKIRYRQVKGVGRVEAVLRKRPGDKNCVSTLLVDQVSLNDRFGYRIRLSPSGKLRVTASTSKGANGSLQHQLSGKWKKQSLYFKAGVYVQDNAGPKTEGGQVTFYWLNTAHL